ncbi:adenylate/guanylate cyclase domain-containing protein [Prochlorothrix hollandica]|uniref:Adenylate cyclase n=1 Tax=Prochlorothrix hollandica PCC 9006 = CALU 1027 TaxID=317619 RepID=A0A0M2PQD3_PROHO|nr:adenylate cyclase [Prochlorothrix hollandica PCC 9006 = CALU 1027]
MPHTPLLNPEVPVQSVPHLILRTEYGERYLPLVDGHCWTVGRNDDNNFVLTDRWISRNHAMVQIMETGEYYLIDLGSRNGSFVNGRRVSIPVVLRHQDNIMFGQTEMEFFCPSRSSASGRSVADDDSQEVSATVALHVRRLISVLVLDIRNFTRLTRQMDEKMLSEMIGSWFRQAGKIINQHGSYVDKYIGDAVMAVWIHGADTIHSDEMLMVFRALDALHEMTDKLQSNYILPFPLRVGAGINTGYAMVGNTGSGDRPDYTALGDTVNAAFRLETATKQVQQDLALGQETYAYAEPLLQNLANPLRPYQVDLKGYESPTLAYACSFAELHQLINHPSLRSKE